MLVNTEHFRAWFDSLLHFFCMRKFTYAKLIKVMSFLCVFYAYLFSTFDRKIAETTAKDFDGIIYTTYQVYVKFDLFCIKLQVLPLNFERLRQ